MARKKTILLLIIFIFIFTFFWELFLTYGFDFFWEDFIYLHLDKEAHPLNAEYPQKLFLLLKAFRGFIKEFFVPHRLFQIGFNPTNFSDCPYQFFTYDLLRAICTDKLIFYKMFKIIIFSINVCILFLIINRVSRLLALLGVFLYINSSEIWLALAYIHNTAVYTQCAVFVSILLFFKLMEKRPLRQKDLWFYYFLILAISNYAVLSKGDGRYLAAMFLLTILFFRRSELRFHLPMLSALLLIEIPVLGYIKRVFTGFPISPINIASHNPRPLIQSLKLIVKNNIFPRVAIGNLLLIILLITILIHLLYMIYQKRGIFLKQIKLDPLHKQHLFTAMLWFIFSFMLSAMSRSFNYDGISNWDMRDCSYFIGPFIIFLSYYIILAYSRLKKPYHSIFLIVCICLMVVQILPLKLLRLNGLRGGWGNYFCAWKNTEEYIDKISDNALALSIHTMPYKPFTFRKSDNKIIPSVGVAKENFSGIVKDVDGLFSNLVKAGYIDEKGIIQNKFRRLKDESEMALTGNYIAKRAEIYKVFKPAYVLPAQKSPFCDLSYIESKFEEEGYSDIFVAARHELKFRGNSQKVILSREQVIDGDSGDLYDRLKRAIGRPPKPLIHLYHFKFKDA